MNRSGFDWKITAGKASPFGRFSVVGLEIGLMKDFMRGHLAKLKDQWLNTLSISLCG